MLELFQAAVRRYREKRIRCSMDAQMLVASDPIGAYYEAQRLAARSRVRGDRSGNWHWARVASEIARIEPRAAMDFEVVKAICDAETADRR